MTILQGPRFQNEGIGLGNWRGDFDLDAKGVENMMWFVHGNPGESKLIRVLFVIDGGVG